MDSRANMLGDPVRPSFEPGDLIERQGRRGKVLQIIQIGVLVEWWDDSRAWVEMGELANLTTGQPAAPFVEKSESHADENVSPLRLQETL